MHSLKEKMGFGCWQIGGNHHVNGVCNGWEPIEKYERVALIERAIELGFKFFDTASGYGDGESEEILGLGIRNSVNRDTIKICTKINLRDLEENGGYTWSSFEKSIQKSLQRLNVEKVDTLLFHSPPQELICEKFLNFFEEAKARKLVDNYGISARSFADLDRAIQINFGQTLQWNFSILEKRAIKILEAQEIDDRFTFIGRSVLYRGLLTEKFVKAGANTKFFDARSQLNFDLVDWVHKNAVILQRQVKDLNVSISDLAIIFAVMNPSVNVGLIGVRTFENLGSLEKLICMNRAEVRACYEIANNFTPLPFN